MTVVFKRKTFESSWKTISSLLAQPPQSVTSYSCLREQEKKEKGCVGSYMGKSSFPDGQEIAPGWTINCSRVGTNSFPSKRSRELVPRYKSLVSDGKEFVPGWIKAHSRMSTEYTPHCPRLATVMRVLVLQDSTWRVHSFGYDLTSLPHTGSKDNGHCFGQTHSSDPSSCASHCA